MIMGWWIGPASIWYNVTCVEFLHAIVAQWTEQTRPKGKVGGSIPLGGAKNEKSFNLVFGKHRHFGGLLRRKFSVRAVARCRDKVSDEQPSGYQIQSPACDNYLKYAKFTISHRIKCIAKWIISIWFRFRLYRAKDCAGFN